MVDCFVSCFRITPHNNDLLKVCLNPGSPTMFHFVLVNVLHRIITQVYNILCTLTDLVIIIIIIMGASRHGQEGSLAPLLKCCKVSSSISSYSKMLGRLIIYAYFYNLSLAFGASP